MGFVLLAHSIRSAFEDGMREYRFLRGGDSYKGRFCRRRPGGRDYGSSAAARSAGRRGRRRPIGRLPRGDRLLARANNG